MFWKKIGLGLFSSLFAATIFIATLTTGCAVYAYYDPYYHDYHPAGGGVVYYSQWGMIPTETMWTSISAAMPTRKNTGIGVTRMTTITRPRHIV